MQYGSGMDFQRNHEEYIRQMQESLRRAQERSLYESVYSPSQNQNQVGDGSAAGSGGGGNPDQGLSTLPSNCIQLVVDTTEDTEFWFNFNSNGAINFTVDWGDGTTHEDSGGGGYYEESHSYPESNQQYTVRICFDDPTIVTSFTSAN
jgi:hypothetical protein